MHFFLPHTHSPRYPFPVPKITRENHAIFRAKAKAAHAKRLESRRKAEELARALLTSNPAAQARVSLSVQLAVLHEAVLAEIDRLGNGKIKGTRLSELIVCQGELLRQAGGIGEGGKVQGELKEMLHEDPEVVKGVQDAAKAVFEIPGEVESEGNLTI